MSLSLVIKLDQWGKMENYEQTILVVSVQFYCGPLTNYEFTNSTHTYKLLELAYNKAILLTHSQNKININLVTDFCNKPPWKPS